MIVWRIVLFFAFIPTIILFGSVQSSSAQEIVLYASQAPVKVGWSAVADSTAAGSARLSNPDFGSAKITTPLVNPANYFEMTFNALAGQPYHLWIRGKSLNDSPYNDSVYVQFSGTVDSSGSPIYRIGTTSATAMNLEDCFGCGLSNWGWQDNGWGIGVLGPPLFFQSTGTQTIRIQVREDGLSIDQIVLSPSTYLYSAPGPARNDTTILQQNSGTTPNPTPTPTPTPSSGDIVIWAANVPASGISGAWAKESNATAAGQTVLRNPDRGGAKLISALAIPTDYFDVTFNAEAGKPYRIWLRGRADNDFWGNDSVFAQFSGSLDLFGGPAYRISTTSAVTVNLEDCFACGIQGWGWQDDGWGVLGPVIYFQNTGAQTLRIQTREDGFAIDQIVLSSSAFLYTSPGLLKNDNTILQSTVQAPPTNQPPQVSISATPTSGNSPLFVSFGSTSSDPDGYITSYSWTFGDGRTSTLQNPTNTYQSAGTYTARVTVTDNSGGAASAAIQINVTSPPSSTSTLRVLSWNIQFGEGTDAVANLDRTATWIANINPDLAALCEVPPGIISTLVNLLSQKTGRTWYWHWVAKFPDCPEGNLILSKYSFVSTSSRYLSYDRSVAQATVNLGGRNVNFFATHLDAYSSTYRYQQVTELQNFASGFGEPRIVCGDFNAGPDLSESIHMSELYYDSWLQAMNTGTAAAYPDNPVYLHTRTRRGRLDYVYYSRGSANLFLQGTQIPDTRNLSQTNVVVLLGTLDDKGVRPSDHNPMIANFEIR